MISQMQKMLESLHVDYADLRYEAISTIELSQSKKGLSRALQNQSHGFVLRVLHRGGMGTALCSTEKDFPWACEQALEQAKLNAQLRKTPCVLASVPVICEDVPRLCEKDPAHISFQEKLKLLNEYTSLALDAQGILNVNFHYREEDRTRYFVSTLGTQIKEPLVITGIFGEILAQDGQTTQNIRVGFGGRFGFGHLLDRHDLVLERRALVLDLLKAEPVSGGTFRCMLDSSLGGVFVHEALGHYSEYDLQAENEHLIQKLALGQEIGNKNLNIVADSSMPHILGYYRYDDEGVPVKRVPLVTHGVVTGRLHSRLTSALTHEEPTGHFVAQNHENLPLIRMGNVMILPQDQTFEELLTQLGDGFLFCGGKGGQTAGEAFSFGAQYGWRIKNGKKQNMVRDINIGGNLFTTLKNIEGIGNDLKISEVGGCGKNGQTNIRSSYGTPHLLIKDLVVGGGL